MATGHWNVIAPGRSGYTEYNDRGEPILSSYYEAPLMYHAAAL